VGVQPDGPHDRPALIPGVPLLEDGSELQQLAPHLLGHPAVGRHQLPGDKPVAAAVAGGAPEPLHLAGVVVVHQQAGRFRGGNGLRATEHVIAQRKPAAAPIAAIAAARCQSLTRSAPVSLTSRVHLRR
jgi:hypothetical protein